jgi:hypothetical protein
LKGSRAGLYSSKRYILPGIAVVSFLLAVTVSFYPGILAVNSVCIDQNDYNTLKSNMSQTAIKFVEERLNIKAADIKSLIKSFPKEITDEDYNYLLDIIEYKIDYVNVHAFFVYIMFIILVAAVIIREFFSHRKYAIAHSVDFLHQAVHKLRDSWNMIFRMDESKTELAIDKRGKKRSVREFG